jgi:hypothetical protein
MPLQGGQPSAWSDALSRIQRNQQSPVYMPAAIAVALEMLDEGAAVGGRFLFLEFERRFASLLQRAGLAGVEKAWQPFFYLSRGARIWELLLHGRPAHLERTPDRRPKSRSELLRMADAAQVHPELLAELETPDGRERIRESLHAALLRSGEGDAPTLARALRVEGLVLCQSDEEILRSLQTFNRGVSSFRERARDVSRATQYWVWDPSTDDFGPGKFVGYQQMSFPLYERARDGTAGGARFDGHLTQNAIRRALNAEFAPSESLALRLKQWAARTLGPDALDGVNEEKWQFVCLPARRRFWGLLANSAVYRVEDAIRELEVDAWTVPTGDIGKGDRIAIWRTRGADGKRGIIAFAEALAPPELRSDPPQSAKYWLIPRSSEQTQLRRILLRYVVPPRLPLWLAPETEAVLSRLSVSRGQGSKAYRIDPEDWWRLIDAIGGWPQSLDGEAAFGRPQRNASYEPAKVTTYEQEDGKDDKYPSLAEGAEYGSAQDPLADLSVGEVIGNFRLIRELGEGGMGRVFLAENPQIGRQVAIKFLLPKYRYSPQFFERFKKEASLLVKLKHPGIVHIFDFGWYPPGEAVIPYMIMDYIDGESLAGLLAKTNSALSIDTILSFAQQMGSALAAVHKAGIIHRDLKPSNIMIVSDDTHAQGLRVILIDFGVAKEPNVKDRNSLTRAGDPVGTMQYMSPEQFHDASSVDPSTDIYSFGKTLQEMIKKTTDTVSPIKSRLLEVAGKMTALERPLRPKADELARELTQIARER